MAVIIRVERFPTMLRFSVESPSLLRTVTETLSRNHQQAHHSAQTLADRLAGQLPIGRVNIAMEFSLNLLLNAFIFAAIHANILSSNTTAEGGRDNRILVRSSSVDSHLISQQRLGFRRRCSSCRRLRQRCIHTDYS